MIFFFSFLKEKKNPLKIQRIKKKKCEEQRENLRKKFIGYITLILLIFGGTRFDTAYFLTNDNLLQNFQNNSHSTQKME